MNPTYSEIASSWSLWSEYVDPGADDNQTAFEGRTLSENISFITTCFGPEQFTTIHD